MNGQSRSVRVTSCSNGLGSSVEDLLAVEEPLEIRLAGMSVAVTMRTPGDDFDLAVGFLITEGIIDSVDAIASMSHCPDDTGEGGNIVNVNLHEGSSVDPGRWQRNFFATSSCGVCGKGTIEAVRLEAPRVNTKLIVPLNVLYCLEDRLRSGQRTFSSTGGLHAAGLFDRRGCLLALREDVGRHNAVDKVIGFSMRSRQFRSAESMLMVSGRASFEVVQKAVKAGVAVVVAVSAPTSLAVELARDRGVTLVGFLRQGRCNVYSGGHRIAEAHPA